MTSMRRVALAVVALHALVLVGHGMAHRGLGVGLSPWQAVFAYSVIVAAPIVASIAVFTRSERGGFVLLAVSMLAALPFGVYHHYIFVSPDHVAHLPAGEHQGLFRLTAAALAILEGAGVVVGGLAWRRLGRAG